MIVLKSFHAFDFFGTPIYFVPEASKYLALDLFIPQRGTQDAQATTASSKSREKTWPACPIRGPRLLPALLSPTRPIMVPARLHRPIGALLERWAGLRQPLPNKPFPTYSLESREAKRTTWRRGSTAGTQATLMVSPSWRTETPASPSPRAGAAGSLC